jgi:hypothetical protein
LPKESKDLIEAGQILNNCLGSYTKMHTTHVLIYFIYLNNEIKYAISINRGDNNLAQFYGKHNSLPELNDYQTILAEFKKRKLIDNSSNFDSLMGLNAKKEQEVTPF